MKIKNLSSILNEGFILANKSIDLVFISISFTLLTSLINYIRNFDKTSGLLFIPLLIVSAAFSLSVPLFLKSKQDSKKLIPFEMLLIVWESTKRIFLPGLLVFAIAAVFLLSAIVFMYSKTDLSPEGQMQYLMLWKLLSSFISVLIVLFEFTAIYFSLENNGLIKSMFRSVLTILQNKGWALFLIIANLTLLALGYLVPDHWIISYLFLFVNTYLSFILTSATFVYYQKVIQNKRTNTFQ